MSERINSIPLPQFIPSKVNIWLKMVKAKLTYAGISEDDLYKYVCMEMPMEIVERLPDILELSVPAEDKTTKLWDLFSETLTTAYGKSREAEIKKLIKGIQLTDTYGPKALMEEMISLAGPDFLPKAILEMFKNALPVSVNRLLMSLDLDKELLTTDELRKFAFQAEKCFLFELENQSSN